MFGGLFVVCHLSKHFSAVHSIGIGLATIDSHSQKEHAEIHKIPKFDVNQASFH